VQRSSVLGHAGAADSRTLVDTKYCVFVAIESHWLRRLALDKSQQLQAACRIVDVRKHRTVRPTIFEPMMLGSINLHDVQEASREPAWVRNLRIARGLCPGCAL
jgi:hypothetical protein